MKLKPSLPSLSLLSISLLHYSPIECFSHLYMRLSLHYLSYLDASNVPSLILLVVIIIVSCSFLTNCTYVRFNYGEYIPSYQISCRLDNVEYCFSFLASALLAVAIILANALIVNSYHY